MANHTVLIIDYEPRSIRASTVPLEKHGFVVEVAHDGIAGLKAFEKLSPALVLIEAMLPKKHGFEVCQEIKKSAQGKGTPVVITTGVYRGRKYRSQALHIYGCDEYLEKPFTEEQLLATCRRFLGETMPEPSVSEHEPVAAPMSGPTSAEKKEVAVERPVERSQWATGTDGNAGTRVSGFGPIVGDLTEAEITARLDAILPAEASTRPEKKASAAAIAVEPTPAAPGIGVAEETVSDGAVDRGAFDSSETPHPFERVAEPAADDLQDVTAEELAGILEPLEPQAEETHDVEPPTHDLRVVQFDSSRDKRRRRKKRSKKQRREEPRGPRSQTRAVSTASPERIPTDPPADMEAHERIAAVTGAAPREDEAPGSTLAREVVEAPNVNRAAPAMPLQATGGEAPLPPTIEETEGKTSPPWMGIAAAVVIGLAATLFFMFRGDGSPRKAIATHTERAAGLGAPGTATLDDDRDPGGFAQDRVDRAPSTAAENAGAKARESSPAAVSGAARPLPVGDAPRPATPAQVSVPRAEPPVEKPAATKPAAPVEDRTTARTDGEHSDSESLVATVEALPAAEPPPSPAPEAPIEEAPADTGALANDEPAEGEPEAPREEPREAAPMTAQGDLVNLHEADVAPTILRHAPPEYPVSARRLRQEGTVILNVLVNEHGNVAEVEVIRGVTNELDAAAVSAAMSWAYRPAEKDGVAVRVWKPEKVTFKL